MRSIAELEKRIRYLEEENKYLKNLLAGAGLSYSEKEIDGGNEYDPDQGSRITPRDITGTDAKVFFSMFWGRTDVYSKRMYITIQPVRLIHRRGSFNVCILTIRKCCNKKICRTLCVRV